MFVAQDLRTQACYAIKQLDKGKIIAKRSVDAVMKERRLLSLLRNP